MKSMRKANRRRIGGLVALGTVIAGSAQADSGAIELSDSSHLRYQINQDITYVSSSSVSGAASEASFTQSVAASTMNGGTTASELNDAFDGAMALAVSLVSATTQPDTSDPEWVFYNQLGAARANEACLAAGAVAPTPATLTGASFASSGFVGGETVTVRFNRVATEVTFTAAEQSPTQVAARINEVLGVTVASTDGAGQGIILTSPRFEAQIVVEGVGAAAIGFSAPVYDGGTLGDAREVIFPDQTIGDLIVNRRVFVPTDDTFMRQLNRFENTGTTAVTFTVAITNNLGSDSNTTIFATSSGDLVADVADEWVGSFQNWSGTTSSDPRLAFVVAHADSPGQPTHVEFTNGDDNPFWVYTLTIEPGQVKTIMTFVTGTPTKAAAQAVAEALVDPRGREAALRCISDDDRATIVNLPAIPCALATDTTCDDGNPATENDVCTSTGTCAGTAVVVDAGVEPDAGSEPDAGTGGETPGGDDGCGCAVAGGSTSTTPGLLVTLLTALVAVFRVRARSVRVARVAARAR